MRFYIFKFLLTYLVFAVLLMVCKPLFMLFNTALYSGFGPADYAAVMLNGFKMDLCVAAYLTVIPGVVLVFAPWMSSRAVQAVWKIYLWFASAFIGMVFVLDTVLYSYWGFKLDTTPFFYFFTSPSAAAASAPWWQTLLGVVAMAVMAVACFVAQWFAAGRYPLPEANEPRQRFLAAGAMLLLTGALFLPMRGGLSVSTMNLSSAYFSDDRRLNHAAVNPIFSLLYSLSHSDDFAGRYRYVTDSEAERIVAQASLPADGPTPLLNASKPDVVLVILESFSSQLLPVQGGHPVALGLDSIAREGLLFNNVYASSFRTDRGLTAILSGYPGQPDTSIMKYVNKVETLPSIAKSLASAGYSNAYFYGGDINFTNMNAYLVSSKFDKVVSDKDFPISSRLSKWGVHDGPVFDMALQYLSLSEAKPRFTVIQTSSSHEPFEVPYSNPAMTDAAANAFAYADHELTRFLNALSLLPSYAKTLVVIVPDHYGAWPKPLEPIAARHRVPLVMTGGALSYRGVVDTFGSQTDIAATILSQLGIDTSPFNFSHDLTNIRSGFAVYTEPGLLGISSADGSAVVDLNSGKTLETTGTGKALVPLARAYIQILYNDLSKR